MNTGIIQAIAGLIWFVFIIVWLITALRAKRTMRRPVGLWIFRTAVILIVILAVEFERSGVRSIAWWVPATNPFLQIVGLVLMIAGIATAFWARYYLGRNWGMPMSLKENPELVTGGPYEYIRNPIYSGVLLAMLGSGWTLGAWWFFILIVSGAYFIYASIQEEGIMAREFPDAYPAYKARTKMLIPFVL